MWLKHIFQHNFSIYLSSIRYWNGVLNSSLKLNQAGLLCLLVIKQDNNWLLKEEEEVEGGRMWGRSSKTQITANKSNAHTCKQTAVQALCVFVESNLPKPHADVGVNQMDVVPGVFWVSLGMTVKPWEKMEEGFVWMTDSDEQVSTELTVTACSVSVLKKHHSFLQFQTTLEARTQSLQVWRSLQ